MRGENCSFVFVRSFVLLFVRSFVVRSLGKGGEGGGGMTREKKSDDEGKKKRRKGLVGKRSYL
jgi:hypothetical protein